jgi:hypothetical protein
LAEVNRQLDARGFVIKRGTLVDATLIAGAVRRPYGSLRPVPFFGWILGIRRRS